MTATSPVVVDTNILFSALLRARSRFVDILFKSEHEFFVSELVIVELFRHKERLVKSSRLGEEELVDAFHTLLRQLTVYKTDRIPAHHERAANELCRGIDETDAPHVALALTLDGVLWTGDQRLRKGLEARGFTRFFEP